MRESRRTPDLANVPLRRAALLILGLATAILIATSVSTADFGTVNIANAGVLGSAVTALKPLVPGRDHHEHRGRLGRARTGYRVRAPRSPTCSGAPTRASTSPCSAARTRTRSVVRDDRAERHRHAVQPEPSDPHAADFAKAAAGQEPWYQPLITGPTINLCRTSPMPIRAATTPCSCCSSPRSSTRRTRRLLKQVLGDDRNPVRPPRRARRARASRTARSTSASPT